MKYLTIFMFVKAGLGMTAATVFGSDWSRLVNFYPAAWLFIDEILILLWYKYNSFSKDVVLIVFAISITLSMFAASLSLITWFFVEKQRVLARHTILLKKAEEEGRKRVIDFIRK